MLSVNRVICGWLIIILFFFIYICIHTCILLFQVADQRVDSLISALMVQVEHMHANFSKALRRESKANKHLRKHLNKLTSKLMDQQRTNDETGNFGKLISYLDKLTTDKSQAKKDNKDIAGLEPKSRSNSPPPSTSKEDCSIKQQTRTPSTSTEITLNQEPTHKKSSSSGRLRSRSRPSSRSRSRSKERSSSRSSYSSSCDRSYFKTSNSSRRSRSKYYMKSRLYKPRSPSTQKVDVYKKRYRARRDYSSSSSCSSSSSSSPSRKKKNITPHRAFSPQNAGKTFQTPNRQNSTCTTHTIQQIRQGSNFMTKKILTTVTSSSIDFERDLTNFKASLNKRTSSSRRSEFELQRIDLLVHDKNDRDVTEKRPDGDLNHPFYVHPEDGKLRYTKCMLIH